MKGLFGLGKKKNEEKQPVKGGGNYLVQYNKKTCIGSGTCAAVCESHWKMMDDGKAMLIGSVFNESTQMFERYIEEKDLEMNKMAAEGCPPNCIIITNKEAEVSV